MIKIQLNGEERSFTHPLSLSELLRDLGLARDDTPVAVALNLKLVPRDQQDKNQLTEGDRIDVVTAVGGG